MEVAHDHTELLGRISAAGWTLNSLKQRGREFVAVATSPSGDKAERIGGTPKMALANLINYIDRANRMAPYKRAKTAAWATYWINDHERLADAYRKLPLYDEKAVPAWRALADESRAQADELRRQIEVIPVGRHNADQYGVDPERPYKSPEDLRNDIRNKRMFVSTENTDHPVWTPEDVANFRTVHNVLGVGQSNSPEYSWRGANMAFQSHAPYLSPDARKALFSEIIGQGAHHRHFRTFSEPRIALMDEHLMPAEDHESHHGINVTPTPVAHAGDPQEPGQWRSAASKVPDHVIRQPEVGDYTIRGPMEHGFDVRHVRPGDEMDAPDGFFQRKVVHQPLHEPGHGPATLVDAVDSVYRHQQLAGNDRGRVLVKHRYGWEEYTPVPDTLPDRWRQAARPDSDGTWTCPQHGNIDRDGVLDDEQGFTCRKCGEQVKSKRSVQGWYGAPKHATLGVYDGEEGNRSASRAAAPAGPATGWAWADSADSRVGASVRTADQGLPADEGAGVVWPNLETIKAIAEDVLDERHQGIRDEGLLDSGISSAINHSLYGAPQDLFESAARLANAIQRQQALVDGNKRTGIASALFLLYCNGYPEAESLVGDASLAPIMETMAVSGDIQPLANALRQKLSAHPGWTTASLGEGPDVPSNLDPALLQKAIELFDAQVRRGEKPVSIFMGVADQLMSSGVPRAQAMEAARKALLNHEDRNLAIQSGPTMKDSPDTGIPNRLQQHGWQFNNWPKGWTEQLEQMPKRQGSEVPDHIPVGWTHKQPDLPKSGDLYSGQTSDDDMPLTEGMRVQHSIDGREGVVTGFHGDGDAAFVKFDDSGRDEIVRARRLKRLGSAEVQQMLDANRGQNLQGLPSKPVNVRGTGPLNFHSHGGIQQIANEYNQRVGLGEHPTNYSPVNPQIATRIAQEYEQMQHAPNDPQVKAAYDALKRESMDQYQALKDAGYTFDFYPEGQDPYPNSPREAVLDLHRNKHMKVFPTMGTDGGFGQDAADYPGHPLLDTVPGETWSRKPVTYNDVFRAIHDVYGHGKEGLGFRAEGEDNAFRQHSAMFSPLAQRALTSETRGQNSYVNYGPHGEHNQTATTDTVYAPQKAGLLPEWVSDPDLHLRGRQAKVARDLATDAVKVIATMGASLNPHTLEPFSALSGYMVSHQAPTEVVAADAFNKGRLLQFRHTAMPYVTASDYLGGWLEDGKVFLDLSEHILDRKEALQRAIDNKQIAIWGWAEQESIYVLDANGNVLPEIAAELNGWRASSFSDADKKRKVRSKAREVAKTDTGAKRVAKTAVEEHASKKLVREALKGEDSDWVEKVLKEMSRIKRTRGAIIMRRVLK